MFRQSIKLIGKNFSDFPFIIPLILGATSFFLVAGPRVLIPTNIAWLGSGDRAQHFLGWQFFRNSDWSFPVGLNPNYGLELSSAIVFSDSNPLFAFIFKPLSSILPEPFQYFGIWILVCFVLQSWFGWKLTGLISNRIAVRSLAACLFVFSPAMLWRLSVHLSLGAHFVVLAAIYLSISPKIARRQLAWSMLLALTALIHAYLLAMVGLLWIADLVGRFLKKEIQPRRAALEFFITSIVVSFACWQAGYFSVGTGTSASGFGIYRLNILSAFDPNGWSYILNDIPDGTAEAGSNFLGLGIIFLIILSIPKLLAEPRKFFGGIYSFPVLLMALIGLTIFALSNTVGVGSNIVQYPLPDFAMKIANIFRASERMFWPVLYAIYFFFIFVIVRGYNSRISVCLLSLALFIQVLDTSAAWKSIRSDWMARASATWSNPLVDPFWKTAASKYSKLRLAQPKGYLENWMPLAYFAAMHGLSTNAAYLARIDSLALEKAQQAGREVLATGNFEADSLYILDDRSLREAALTFNPSRDMLAVIDGLNVLAPGWNRCTNCPVVENTLNFTYLFPQVEPGQRIFMGKGGEGLPYLLRGWSVPEDWGTWSDGDSAEIVLPLHSNTQSVVIEAFAFVSPTHPKQNISVVLDGIPVSSTSLTAYSGNLINLTIPKLSQQSAVAPRIIRIKLLFQNAVKPAAPTSNGDMRKLAIGLKSITIK